MNKPSATLGFIAGFLVATVFGLAVVVPGIYASWQAHIDSEVHLGVQFALESIEKSATAGDCEKAATQLRLFNKRFAAYRNDEGPPPELWWQEITTATRPTR